MDKTYKLRLTDAERATWQAAADRENLPLATWMRRTLTSTANQSVAEPVIVQVSTYDEFKAAVKSASQSAPKLCHRCSRFGIPACDKCRKANET